MHFKVLTNEKRGGLKVVSFDRSPFQLFSLWIWNKSVPAPSCERPKTALRTLFLLFANNNCIPISTSCQAATNFSQNTIICNNSIVRGASKIKLKKVNKENGYSQKGNFFLNISRHLLLIWLHCCLHQYKTLKAMTTAMAAIVVLTPAKNLNKVFWGFPVVSPLV